jgi:predicted amidohydrolase YtcJ
MPTVPILLVSRPARGKMPLETTRPGTHAMIVRILALAIVLLLSRWSAAQPPDLILHHGKIATVDAAFSLTEAIAIRDERIVAVGKSADLLATKGDATKLVDLGGKLVLPGLIDSHVHPSSAAMHEFDHPIPEMESMADVLAYIKSRAAALPEGSWISVRQVFITRLKEQRYPTKAELDAVAPKHPVVFSTGPDSMLNTLALKESGIDKNYKVSGPGIVDKDPATGEPTGLLRSVSAKSKSSEKSATSDERLARLEELFRDYNSVGLTTVADRNCSPDAITNYQRLREAGRLSVRMRISHSVDADGRLDAVQEKIREIARHPLRKNDPALQIVGIKCFLDGGMLTGSAYMREPWGLSDIYLIRDPAYRGVLKIEPEKLSAIVKTTVDSGLQFTAHSVGDGAVHALLDAYEETNRTTPVRPTRPCITHCNFMSREAIEKMARLGVVADIQPAWLYLDARTLSAQFGNDRLRYFQPLKTIFEHKVIAGGGSDHMQKIGSLRSVNPYNPFLGMWVTLSRRAKWFDGQLHAEEALTREQAIRFYTANNAYLVFLDDQVGSLEVGKLADLIVLDRDLLTCQLDDIKYAQVVTTYLGGKQVFPRP